MNTKERLKLIDEINSRNEDRIREWNKQLMSEVKRHAEQALENLGYTADAFGLHRKVLVEMMVAVMRDLEQTAEQEYIPKN